MQIKSIKVNNVKMLKIIGIITALIIAVFYILFLLVLPNVVNLNNYKKDIQKIVTDNCKLNIDFENAKIVTSPLLSAGVKLTGLKISYPDKTVLLNTNMAEVKVAVLPLITKNINVSSVKIETPQISLDILSDDRFKIEKFLTENMKQQVQKEQTNEVAPLSLLDFTIKFPSVKVSDYNLILRDLKTSDTIAIAGKKLLLADVELNKRARVVSQGQVLLNNKENISYDINIDTFLPDLTKMPEAKVQKTQTPFVFNPVKAFKTYNLKANLSAKLKIRDRSGINIKGFLNTEKISFSLPNKTLPESYVKLLFKGQKVSIDSNLCVAQNEEASILGDVAYGKNQLIDLKVHTDKIGMKSIQEIAAGFLDALGIKHEDSKINSQGYLKADFNLKTNLKKIKSSGTFDVVNASFTHKTIPASIKNLNINVDLSGDEIKIKKFQAFLNGSLFEVLGHIDTDSHADIKVVTNNLQLANFYSAFAPKSLRDSIVMKSGSLNLNAIIKGRLDEIRPEVNLSLTNLALKEKVNNINIANKSILTKLSLSPKGYNGSILTSGTSVSMPAMSLNIHNQSLRADFDDKNAKINPSIVYINSSPITISGEIKDYLKKCDINIAANGRLKSSDIVKLLPREVKPLIAYSGQLPFNLSLEGTPQKMFLNGKVNANANNHFSPITINKLLNKPSVVNIVIELTDNSLRIKDLGIYDASSSEIVKITGSISELNKRVQKIDGIKLYLPSSLNMSTRAIKNSHFDVQGKLDVTGTSLKPILRGNMNISNVSLPDFMTKIQSIVISMRGDLLNAKIRAANVNGSIFNVDADARLTSSPIFTISRMNLASPTIDADKLFVALDKIAKMTAPAGASGSGSSSSAVAAVPVRILQGYAKIDKFKMGEIIATNISGNFNLHKNLVKIPKLAVTAYNGLITGSATYNIVTLAATANVKGSGIDANPAVTAFLLVKDQLFGTAKFKANVSLRGATYEEQLRALNGTVGFNIENGQFGSLGRFENFLKAPNLLSQSFIRTSIGSVINTVAPYNTGNFKYLKGRMTFSNGIAEIKTIKSSGSNMSLFITGYLNLLNNNANMTILGRISSNVVGVLGPLSQLTTDKITRYIPSYGLQAMSIFRSFTDKSSQVDLNKIPALTPSASNTQDFKVYINGNIANPLSVKSFKWLSTANEMERTQSSLDSFLKARYGTTIKIPKTKQEVIQTIVQTKQVQEKIQQIQQNEKIQKLKDFGNLIKQYSE